MSEGKAKNTSAIENVKYSKVDCIKALKLSSEELGTVLSETEYERFRNIFEEIEIVYLLLPSIETIRDKFGTFGVAIQEAFQTKGRVNEEEIKITKMDTS